MARSLGTLVVCVVVALAPLPFGSVEPFWGAVWCVLLGLALFVGGQVSTDVKIHAAILLLLLVVAAWCAVVALQYTVVGALLPAGPGWDEAGRVLGDHALAPKVAAYGQIPIAAVVPPLALVLALLAGLVFGSEPSFTPRIYSWAAIAGLAYAGYSIFAEITNPDMLLWRQKSAYIDAATGTFVNHNTAATFFGCIAIIWYLRVLREFRRRINISRWRDLEYVFVKLKKMERFQIGYAIAFFVVLATTFMTRSRAGSLLTVAALGAVTLLYFADELKSVRRMFIGAIALALLGALAIAAAGGQFTNEIETRGVFDAGRAQAWLSALAIVHDHPWIGTGLGTFASVFPAYRAPAGGIWGVWDRAHSTPIELMVEMGIPFATLVLTLWLGMLAVLLRAALRRRSGRLYIIAGAGIAILASLHSMVDFSLQIPGFSVVCCVLTGASLAAALTAAAEPVRRRERMEEATVAAWG
jgi:hypothetical protein